LGWARRSGKSHFFAGPIIDGGTQPSNNGGERLRVVCIREQLQDLKESAKLLIEDELQEFGDLQGRR